MNPRDRRPLRLLAVLGVLCALAPLGLACSDEPAAPEPAIDPLAGLGPGWNPIEPGGETICSDGSPYRFFARVADPARLMVYFQGGGGCWTGATCDPDGRPTYKRVVEAELRSAAGAEPEEGAMHGIFAFGHPENPFADYSVVFVPYCTGDVHLGNAVTSYTAPAGTTDEGEEHPEHEVTVHHKGWANSQAALAWTAEHFRAPETVFVSGSSAGAIPSPVYARQLAESYPEARVVQLGDGAGGYRNLSQAQPHVQWNALGALASRYAEFASMAPEEFSFEALYTTSGKADARGAARALRHRRGRDPDRVPASVGQRYRDAPAAARRQRGRHRRRDLELRELRRSRRRSTPSCCVRSSTATGWATSASATGSPTWRPARPTATSTAAPATGCRRPRRHCDTGGDAHGASGERCRGRSRSPLGSFLGDGPISDGALGLELVDVDVPQVRPDVHRAPADGVNRPGVGVQVGELDLQLPIVASTHT
jgi:hypothetical protein